MAQRTNDQDDRSALAKAQLHWLENQDDPKALAALLKEEAKPAEGSTPSE